MQELEGIVPSKEKTITFELVTTMGFIQKHIEQKRFGVNASKNPSVRGNAYTYDQLNRLSSSRTFTNLNYTTNQWQFNSITNPQAYATNYTYDAMGNILTQKRNGNGVTGYLDLDDLTYNYHTNGDGLISNRLYSVNDAVSSGNYTDDIDDQGTFDNTHSTIETANNYGYDELGNLVRDDAEEIEEIVWNTYGKIKEVKRVSTSDKPDLEFLYDASGQRLAKIVKPKPIESVEQPQVATWYIRDAQGNVMAVYSYKMAVSVDEEAVECEDVVGYLVTEHGAETFANFATQEIEAHNWTNGPDEIESAIITASKQMDVVYELDPSILLGSDPTLFDAVLTSFDVNTLVGLVVANKGVLTVSVDLCNINTTWTDHLYASNPNDYLTELNGVSVTWMQNLWDHFYFPTPYPGFGTAAATIMGQPNATVSAAITTLGGCLWNNAVASALENTNSGTIENALISYSLVKQDFETIYGATYLIGLMDDYSRTGLWDAIIATTLYDDEDILAYYKTNDTENFVKIAVKNHPEGFCDMAAEEGFDFMEHKTEIKNFYVIQAYKNLMEYLKILRSKKVQAFVLDELHIYGSSRLGVLKVNLTLVEIGEEENIIFEVDEEYMHRDLGNKRYELSNHLGNVLVTVTDKKIYVEDAGSVDHFLPEIMSISDYYPFGSAIAARAYASGEYRYGFNGKEIDMAGEGMGGGGNTYDYGFRIYNPNLGRFLSVDPLFQTFPWYTPYQFAGNKIIIAIDLDGLEEFVVIIKPSADGKTTVKTIDYIDNNVQRNFNYNPDDKTYKPKSESGITQRKEDPLNPLIGTGGVQYITMDAEGNILSSERKADFITGSNEAYIMNQDATFSNNSNMTDPQTGKRRDAMGKYLRDGYIYSKIIFQEIIVAEYDNESNKMKAQTEQIDNVIKKLQRNSNIVATVVGRTDKDPMTPYITPTDPDGNNRLSEERANEVKELLKNGGVASERISVHGAGSSQANQEVKDPNDRRVEVLIYTKDPAQ